MTVEDLKGVKLSQVTAGYLGIYIVLVELHINEDFYRSLMKAQDEIMKLCNQSITGKLQLLRNHTEI